MKHSRVLLLVSVLASVAFGQALHAQTAARLLEQGIRAYQDLEFDAAAGFLRRALEPSVGQGLTDPDAARVLNARALTYLAATEIFRGNSDSARAVFGRLVRLDTRYRPDQLVFPPAVANVYDAVRRETKVVTVIVPQTTRLQLGDDRFSLRLYASSYHDASVDIRDQDSIRVREVYRGPIVDSLDLEWDGRDAERVVVQSGSYHMWISSRDSTGSIVRVVQVPLDIEVESPDTLIHPLAPAGSELLPEQHAKGPGMQALAGGILIGTAVAVLPAALSSDTDIMGARIAVAGTISIAGLTAFLRLRPGKPIAQNIEANSVLWRSWEDSVAVVVNENGLRKADIQLIITTGPRSVSESSQ
jgi:hypothetical protein